VGHDAASGLDTERKWVHIHENDFVGL
jgi:hypothetical protein